MSTQQYLTTSPSITFSKLETEEAPPQGSELISNKTDKDGHHYLKVLLLSNKKTRNNWIVPYQKIGDLPKDVIDSFMGLPHVSEHQYPYFIQLKDKLVAEGKEHDEVARLLKEVSQKMGLDYIDHLFYDPNSPLLYGQLKIMDKKENEYISKNGRPSKNFTSPGVFGDAYELQDGTNVYDKDTLRGFHIASVDIPAFPESEAEIKGVCKNGNSESCRKVLAVAGFNSTDPSSIPSENVNNTCSCNKNIDMSNQPQVTSTSTTTSGTNDQGFTLRTAPNTGTTSISPDQIGTLTGLVPGAQNTTQDAIDAARKEAQKVVEENKQKAVEENKPQPSEAELELKKASKELEKERGEKLEMKNFFLEKMLISAIPRENFAKEDEFLLLKESTKGLINKYGMSLEDADWLISKVSKSVPPLSTESEKEPKKKSVGVGGWYGSTYNSDIITKTVTPPQPASNGSNLDDEDYPIKF